MRRMTSACMASFATVLLFAMSSCATIENPEIDNSMPEASTHVCKMVFNGEISGYENTVLRGVDSRASASWQDNDKVYIAFKNGENIVPGEATYSLENGWAITFDGDLTEGSNQSCEVRFFVNPTFANEFTVNLNPNSEIYEALDATYSFTGNEISVSASLVPKVGRIRFTGEVGAQIHVTGIMTHSTYSPASNVFTTTFSPITLTVAENGSTPYIYGYCAQDDRKVGLVVSDFAFTRTFAADIFNQGDSGYMAIPSAASHNNWKSGLYVKANDVEFKMIPVAGYSEGFFLIGETEVTNAMWEMNSKITKASKPVTAYYNAWTTYISQLKYATSLSFYIPTMGEWQFAAQGGLQSQGFVYSGSNTPGDVAWFAGNSGGEIHDVKQLAPNELGIYDMSGNFEEWTSNRSVCGGAFYGSENDVTVSSARYIGDSSSGLRLALKFE